MPVESELKTPLGQKWQINQKGHLIQPVCIKSLIEPNNFWANTIEILYFDILDIAHSLHSKVFGTHQFKILTTTLWYVSLSGVFYRFIKSLGWCCTLIFLNFGVKMWLKCHYLTVVAANCAKKYLMKYFPFLDDE